MTVETEERIIEHVLQLNDQVDLNYYVYKSSKQEKKKSQQLLVLCPGFFFSGRSMLKHMQSFSDYSGVHLLAIDWRGHGSRNVGDSENVTIQQLAADLQELIAYIRDKNLVTPETKISLLGNSMGVNVMWRYVDVFGESAIHRHVFVDQPAAITGSNNSIKNGYLPTWTIHSTFVARVLSWVCYYKDILVVPLLRIFKPAWFTKRDLAFYANSNGPALGKLLIDTTSIDNCDRIKIVKKPCLVYGGSASFVPVEVHRWIANRVSGPSRLLLYPAPYGTHAPFVSHLTADKEAGERGKRRFEVDLTRFLEASDEVLDSQGTAYVDNSTCSL
jgi:pimeloyl-ACP methyl ester carboxylesterase